MEDPLEQGHPRQVDVDFLLVDRLLCVPHVDEEEGQPGEAPDHVDDVGAIAQVVREFAPHLVFIVLTLPFEQLGTEGLHSLNLGLSCDLVECPILFGENHLILKCGVDLHQLPQQVTVSVHAIDLLVDVREHSICALQLILNVFDLSQVVHFSFK